MNLFTAYIASAATVAISIIVIAFIIIVIDTYINYK